MVDPRFEEIYEEYLDALLDGSRETPRSFLRERGFEDPDLEAYLAKLQKNVPAGSGPIPSKNLPYRRLGEYRILQRLGSGGMGVVYLAQQESLDRLVALKVIRPEHAHAATVDVRFDREARAAAKLRHPNIVTVHGLGEDQGIRYLVLERVEGRGLDEILADARGGEAPLSLGTIIRWGIELAHALHYAHGEQIVHRDVKPGNVIITPEGKPMLLDFGLARELRETQHSFTQDFVGTLYYAAPEQVQGKEGRVDGRTDVFALGVVLYEALVGHAPFSGGSTETILHRILKEDPPPVREANPLVPRDLDRVVMKALEKNPAHRYVSAGALAEDLTAVVEFRPVSARPAGLGMRTGKWIRRKPAQATATATFALALLVIAGLLIGQRVQRESERRRLGRDALTAAEEVIASYRESRIRTEQLEQEYAALSAARQGRFLSEEEDRRVNLSEDGVREGRQEREQIFQRFFEEIRRAERWGADPAAIQSLHAQLYLERFHEARAAGDRDEIQLYQRLVREHDPQESLASELVTITRFGVVSDPPGAEVFVYEYHDLHTLYPEEDHRLVPVPVNAPLPPVDPRDWALRVENRVGSLNPGDLVVEVAGRKIRGTVLVVEGAGEVARLDQWVSVDGVPIRGEYEVAAEQGDRLDSGGAARVRRFTFERKGQTFTVEGKNLADLGLRVADARSAAELGGVPAVVYRDGERLSMELPSGLRLRTTAAPVALGPEAYVGRTPLEGLELDVGASLVVLRKPGYVETRSAWVRSIALYVPLVRDHLVPSGTVPIYNANSFALYFLEEHETTSADYLEFLNDPSTQSVIGTSAPSSLVPRRPDGPRWSRGPGGKYELPPDWAPDRAVTGISWSDANAYAAWKTQRAHGRGETHLTYALPTSIEWFTAKGRRSTSYGVDRFRPKWISSCFGRPVPAPEPVLRYPIDESPYRVFDMMGSVSEWTAEWYGQGENERFIAGGSWAVGGPEVVFENGQGQRPDEVNGMVGFRLAVQIDREAWPSAR